MKGGIDISTLFSNLFIVGCTLHTYQHMLAGEVLVGRTGDLVGVWATEAYDLGMFPG